jgi:hypothetical protein
MKPCDADPSGTSNKSTFTLTRASAASMASAVDSACAPSSIRPCDSTMSDLAPDVAEILQQRREADTDCAVDWRISVASASASC